jgi:hypothetical protein
MFRKSYLLMFVLLSICGDTALARHGKCFLNQGSCVSTCCNICSENVIRHCLKDIYMHFPTGPEVYYCLTYDDGCPDNGYEDCWYGNESHPLPQSCSVNPLYCESEPKMAGRYGGGPPPGHEDLPSGPAQHRPFANKQAACDWLTGNLDPSTTGGTVCGYYKFRYKGIRYAVIIDVNATNTGAGYLGVETNHFSGEPFVDLTAASSAATVTPNTDGTMLRITYNDGGTRHALVWLKHYTPH